MKTLFAASLAAATMLGAGAALADSLDVIEEQCGTQYTLSADICSCLRDTASHDLSQDQQDYLAAKLMKDDAKMSELKGKLTAPNLNAADIFMVTAPSNCVSR